MKLYAIYDDVHEGWLCTDQSAESHPGQPYLFISSDYAERYRARVYTKQARPDFTIHEFTLQEPTNDD